MNNLLQLILHKSIGMCLFKELRLTCWKFDFTLQWVKKISTTDYAGNMVGVRRKKEDSLQSLCFNDYLVLHPHIQKPCRIPVRFVIWFFKIIILGFIFVFQWFLFCKTRITLSTKIHVLGAYVWYSDFFFPKKIYEGHLSFVINRAC